MKGIYQLRPYRFLSAESLESIPICMFYTSLSIQLQEKGYCTRRYGCAQSINLRIVFPEFCQ
jgi:hypothetical protein